MSIAKVEMAINVIKTIKMWDSFLIEYNHESHPNEYICYNMNFSSINLLLETVYSMCDTFLDIVKKQNCILEYTAQNPKNVTEKILMNNNLIQSSWSSLKDHINFSDDTKDLKSIKAKAYIFVGSYTEDNGNIKNIYLFNKKNPILSFKKRIPIFTSQNNTIKKSDEVLIQFSKAFDGMIFDNTLYSINNNFESIFNIEYSYKIICRERLIDLENADIILDIENYKLFASSGHYPQKFITYDNSMINKLRIEEYKIKLSQELHIPIESQTKKFDLSDPKDARNFTLAICGKTKINMFNDGICEVPYSTPLLFF